MAHIKTAERELFKKNDDDQSPGVIFLIFHKPEITQQLHFTTLGTMTRVLRNIQQKRLTHLPESVFFVEVDHENKKVMPTLTVQKFSAFEPIPAIETSERNTLVKAVIHIHPPTNEPLVPSVIERDHEGKMHGDLYLFSHMRKLNHEDEERGLPVHFAFRFISVILQQDFLSEQTKILLLMERNQLKHLSDEAYIEMLENYRAKVGDASDEIEVQRILREMGYLAGYITVPTDSFYDFPPLTVEQYNELITQTAHR